MLINNAGDLLRIVRERGLEVYLSGQPPQPYLRGDRDKVSKELLAALKAWRWEIINLLGRAKAS